mmetsp:Transcript_28480/g.55549  ORF Transcript_28480/g.55549 Transcript_28480/m.55549 type:complete len:610 (+) Transcript_28480:83-1912(+)|eukprot:CAMPEP_0173405722 /NCGR_PEP_ID=MMETSP1356-20130122/62552_1 /TAXON_ID=77927 ORGANISM="Hemiselmis virescens, Strain PCC157" /NCGR_SAMPLE_ID=MMETSP1356 /ASSEMBLY_ACC=CAM_ASM_000847 /LENGTH=609 /DNA_ID=CAMNT_0014366557 /DNA_START=12 /DNA_END=1841 /DNA_ORIENTATION=-
MFYVSELNLKGKGPLSRLWQACHYPNKISKKVIETFDYKEGYDAIMAPDDDRVWALRLNGQLLLGYVRIHGMKINLLQDNIKMASDRFKIRFNPNSAAVDLDISKGTKGKSESKRSEELQMTVSELEMMLDIPDEVPSWLKSEEWQMSQQQAPGGFPAASPGGISAISSRNRSSIINLPDASQSGSGFGAPDDVMYSDMLEVPGSDMPEELEAYEDFNYAQGGSSSRGVSSSGRGDDFDGMYDDGAMQYDDGGVQYDAGDQGMMMQDDDAKAGAVKARPTKKARKSGKIETETQISKDEFRKWVQDKDWVKTHLCKPRRPIGSTKELKIVDRVSMPVSGGFGKRLTRLFTEKLACSEKITPKKKAKGSSAKKAEAGEKEDEVFDNPDYGNDMDYAMQYDGYGDGGDVAYGEASSDAGGGTSEAREDPERMRAGSEERRASRESQGLNADRLSGSDRMSLPSFDLQTPQGSVMSGSLASSRGGRMPSIGEVYDPYDPLSLADDHDDSDVFQSASLKEEPESLQTTYSQLPASQRLSEHSVLVARQIAMKLPDEDSELTFHYLTRNLNNRNAARCFYSMLLLVNENVVKADQVSPYGEIVMTATDNTAMYA